MDATIGQSTNSLWLFGGTGDYERINDTTPGVSNYLIGIKDPDYPLYKNTAYAIELNITTQIKEWDRDIRIMLEEAGFYGENGFRYVNKRQTEIKPIYFN